MVHIFSLILPYELDVTVSQGGTLGIDPRLRRVNLVRYIFVSILVLVQNVNIFIGVRRVELAYLRQYEHS